VDSGLEEVPKASRPFSDQAGLLIKFIMALVMLAIVGKVIIYQIDLSCNFGKC